MKILKTIVGTLGFFTAISVYSAEQFSAPIIRSGQDFKSIFLYAPVSEGGSTLVSNYCFTIDACAPTQILQESYVPNLKPRGSNIAHGSTGYIENAWVLSDNSVLFSTEIFASHYSYLYKIPGYQSLYGGYPATVTVGNNASDYAYDNRQAVLNLGERNGVQQADVRTLHHRSLLEATINGAKVLFYGEYNNSSRAAVALMKSTDMGDTWTKVIEWNTVGHQTRHIRGVVQNPYNGWIYILFGFQPADSAIVAWNGTSAPPPDNTPLNQMGNYPGWKSIAGSARVRTGDLVFTPQGKCVWLPDADTLNVGEKLFGQRANYDLTGLEATGEAPFVNGISPIIGARSDSGNIYWASYRKQGATENSVHVWKSTDSGLSWSTPVKANVYTDWTAIPHDFRVNYDADTSGTSGGGRRDILVLSGRDLEFVNGGPKLGSGISWSNFLNVTLPPPPPPPGSAVATADAVSTSKGQAVTFNPTSNDTNIGTSIVNIVGYPGHGNVAYSDSTSKSITYTPNATFTGTDTFTYNLKSSAGTSNTVTVTITVGGTTPPPPPPPTGTGAVANGDTMTTTKGKAVTLNLTSNDTNVGTSTVNIAGYPNNGNVAYSDSTKKSITYTPDATFVGSDSFTYNLKSASGTSNTATVSVKVQ